MKSNKELNKECGQRLRDLLKEKNVSQKSLAEETNFTTQYISNIINGKRPMTVTAAKSFSSILGVPEAFLLCESDYIDGFDLETYKEEFEFFEYHIHFLLHTFDIDLHGLLVENENGKEYYYYGDDAHHFTLPISLDEKECNVLKLKDENGEIFSPQNPRVILLVCQKKVYVPLASFRSLVKDIYEYINFRTRQFTQKYTDKEQDIKFWEWFEKE